MREERDAAIEVRDAPLPQTMMALVNARREARGLEAENARYRTFAETIREIATIRLNTVPFERMRLALAMLDAEEALAR